MAVVDQMQGRRFQTDEAVVLAGTPRPNVQYWCQTGLFNVPVGPTAHGRGRTRLWGWTDLIALRTVQRLRDAGISLQAVRKVAEVIAREAQDTRHALATKRLVTDGTNVMAVRSDRELVSLLKQPGQHVWSVIALGDVEAELRDRVQQADAKQAKPQRRGGRRAA